MNTAKGSNPPPSSILKPKYLLKAIFNGKRQAADYYP
jgi:hypothetical protein